MGIIHLVPDTTDDEAFAEFVSAFIRRSDVIPINWSSDQASFDAVSDVLRWHAATGNDIELEDVRELAIEIREIRRHIVTGTLPDHLYSTHSAPTGEVFDVTDDAGVTWRIRLHATDRHSVWVVRRHD